MNKPFYDLSAKNLQGKEVLMADYKEKIIIIVNTASQCGFTPQLEGLEAMYRKYKDQGLVILGFPCNQFGNQEPGDEQSIAEGCVVNYGVSFPMFSKVDVNGKNAHPVYQYLRKELPGWFGNKIKWNFTKFILNKDGKPVKRFPPTATPAKVEKYVKSLL